MLEIPESQTIAGQLRAHALGQTVIAARANAAPHRFAFYFGDPADYPRLLMGGELRDAQAHGGLIELTVGENRLVLGDGVNLRCLAPGRPAPAKHQLLLSLDSGASLVATVQMYGGIWAFPPGRNDNFYYLVAKEKPSPLSAAFDARYFEALLQAAKPGLSVKAFLATEQRIPGLGNGVLQDILFRAGLHPRRRLDTLDDAARERLFVAVKDILAAMTAQGGRDTEKDLFGAAGGYRTQLSNKTWKQPCPRCGGAVERQAYLGGNVYFCPACQRL